MGIDGVAAERELLVLERQATMHKRAFSVEELKDLECLSDNLWTNAVAGQHCNLRRGSRRRSHFQIPFFF
jgi:hypothetical protein